MNSFQPPETAAPAPLTLGVFDSGFGGLTVLRSLLQMAPSVRYLYLGDTARLPYGSKSRETIARYAVSSARFLLERGADLLVIACNTATALALPEIRAAVAPVPVFGVIQPGAEAVRRASSPVGPTIVIATAATVQSHAYLEALSALGVPATELPCPLLVPLVEEGWIDHPVTEEVARIYLAAALEASPAAESLLLGCTHYPLLRPLLTRALARLGHPLRIIDSAEATAEVVAAYLKEHCSSSVPPLPVASQDCTFFATDSVEKFQRLGSGFLGRALPSVHLVDLGG